MSILSAILKTSGILIPASMLISCLNQDQLIKEYSYPVVSEHQGMIFNINKTEYFNSKIKVHCSTSENSDILNNADLSVTIYDRDLNILAEHIRPEYKSGILTIKSNNADKISGIAIYDKNIKIANVRHLDSEQYAMLEYLFVHDLGTKIVGDKNTFYTEAEKQEQLKKVKEVRKKSAEAYNFITGHWKTKDSLHEVIFSASQNPEKLDITYRSTDPNSMKTSEFTQTADHGIIESSANNSEKKDIFLSAEHGKTSFTYTISDHNHITCQRFKYELYRVSQE